MSHVYFTSVRVKKLRAEYTLPFKFRRLLKGAGLADVVRGKKVCVKMHLGGGVGYTTIHPVFVRALVEEVRAAGARSVFVGDGRASVRDCAVRGYTRRALGCKVVPFFRPVFGRTVATPIGYKDLDEALLAKDLLGADALVDLSHVKGHGDCGFGGAAKNIAMGCVPGETRRKIHSLEGGIHWHAEKCTKCRKCVEACPNEANKFDDDGKYEVFWHDCTYCRHCVLACPAGALETTGATFADFQEGMARVVSAVLDHFGPENLFCANFLTNVTVYCDCWGFSTPPVVPDVGILASRDLVAVDKASLDLVREEDFRPESLPEGRALGKGRHLFEKIHAKDPYLVLEILAKMGKGNLDYQLVELEEPEG
ncbi:MAG: DUF362 domain-containing protein [Promethearchaeota archaeon]